MDALDFARQAVFVLENLGAWWMDMGWMDMG